jgi:flagellar assembly protein FliH
MYIPCPLCKNDSYREIFEIGDLNQPLRNVICMKCGLIYINPRPDEAEYLAYQGDSGRGSGHHSRKSRESAGEKIVQSDKKIKEKVYNETLQLAKTEAEKLKTLARELLKELFEVKRKALIQAHSEIINVALTLAEKIIRYQATIDPNLLKTQVIEAIKKATSEADRVQVFVNPSDLKNLEENIQGIEKLFPSGVEIIALANEGVDPGSCIVETKSGQLDASFSAQLKTVTELVSHLDIKEAQIQLDESIEIPETKEIKEEAVQDLEGLQEVLTEEDEEILNEELLGTEPLIEIPHEEEDFPFAKSEVKEEPQEEITPEDIIKDAPEEKVSKVEDRQITTKRKLSFGDLAERTEEEAKELDEGFSFEEEEEEEKEEIDLSSILKPKKKPSSSVSDVVKEVDESPEWKNLIEEEE